MASTKRSASHTKSSQTGSSTTRSGSKSRSAATTRKSSSTAATGARTKTSTRSASHSGKATAHKTAHGKASTDKHSSNPSSTGHGKAKKEPAKQTSTCWPGYEPVPGKARGAKGSCKPKANQTAAEKKSDAMAASASKLRKAGGNKARANHSR